MIKEVKWNNHPILGNLVLNFCKTNGDTYKTIILAGENGTGKTSILETISTFLNCGSILPFEYIKYSINDIDYTIPSTRAYVSRLIVKKGFRQQGIGKELVKFIKTKAKEEGFSELAIGVDLDNYPALRLYITTGFTQIIRIDEDEQGKFMKVLCVL